MPKQIVTCCLNRDTKSPNVCLLDKWLHALSFATNYSSQCLNGKRTRRIHCEPRPNLSAWTPKQIVACSLSRAIKFFKFECWNKSLHAPCVANLIKLCTHWLFRSMLKVRQLRTNRSCKQRWLHKTRPDLAHETVARFRCCTTQNRAGVFLTMQVEARAILTKLCLTLHFNLTTQWTYNQPRPATDKLATDQTHKSRSQWIMQLNN